MSSVSLSEKAQLKFVFVYPKSKLSEKKIRRHQLRYVAGAGARATYAMRLQLGDEAFSQSDG
jgi:hypothetical protein